MGLTLYAIRDLKPVMLLQQWREERSSDGYPEVVDDEQYCLPHESFNGQEEIFPGRAAGIVPDMVYDFDADKTEQFPMGGYGTYCGFRRTVEMFADANNIYDKFEDVLYFSDCDGNIGPIASARLADAFKENRDGFAQFLKEMEDTGEEWREVTLGYYDNMTEAFEIARNDGVVLFC